MLLSMISAISTSAEAKTSFRYDSGIVSKIEFLMQNKVTFPVGIQGQWRSIIPSIDSEIASWLYDPSSLTAKLKSRTSQFSVELIGQAELIPEPHELEFLNIESKSGHLVREVLLKCDGLPWVFARSVLPLASLSKTDQELAQLGENPLGEFLFHNPTIQPGTIKASEFTASSKVKGLDESLHQGLEQKLSQPLFGRRRLFHLQNGPILVAEVFLSSAPCYAHDKETT